MANKECLLTRSHQQCKCDYGRTDNMDRIDMEDVRLGLWHSRINDKR